MNGRGKPGAGSGGVAVAVVALTVEFEVIVAFEVIVGDTLVEELVEDCNEVYQSIC